MSDLLSIENLRYSIDNRNIIDVPQLSVNEKEHILLLGPSGSGKTSLLHLIAGLIEPSEGSIWFSGKEVSSLNSSEKDLWRGSSIGFVFQGNHLIRHMSAYENISLVAHDEKRISYLLETLGLKGKEHRKAATLSFGEAQRVGIARAVVHKPKLILADEPTSALDDINAKNVIALMKEQAKEAGAALIVCSHDVRILKQFDRVILMKEGKVLSVCKIT